MSSKRSCECGGAVHLDRSIAELESWIVPIWRPGPSRESTALICRGVYSFGPLCC